LVSLFQRTSTPLTVLDVGAGDPYTEGSVSVYPANRPETWDFECDALIIEQHTCDIYEGVRGFPQLLDRCGEKLVGLAWAFNDDQIANVDPRIKAFIFYARYPFETVLPDVPVLEWLPFNPDIHTWDREKTRGNVLLWSGSNNIIGDEIESWQLRQVFQAWENVYKTLDGWYMDVNRCDQLIAGDTDVQNVWRAREILCDTPRVRFLPMYRYDEWLRYCATSSLFLVRDYIPSSMGPHECAFMGVPSMLPKTAIVPDDYAFTLDKAATQDAVEGMLVRLYSYVTHGAGASVIVPQLDYMQEAARAAYSYDVSKERMVSVLGEIEGLL
jgi:hypothetical protein